MDEQRPWEYTCKTCGDHNLIVTHVWTILAGEDSENWREWGPLEADHLWRYDFKEKIEEDENEDDEGELGDFGEFAEDDSTSEPEDYETFEQEDDLDADEYYVNCEGCDREIEFGWSQPDGGGRIFPVECSDFIPGEIWPEPRYLDLWQKKHWFHKGSGQA
jgi:hypothetical protein